jgi:acyl-coenzyme A synthetase/AMP-(fatty) acid ligase/acyl carrier protein
MQATPATWRMLLAAGWPALQPGFRVWCGGEALTSELAAALLERGVALWNVYGPTETTIWSTLHGAASAPSASRVGLPIANTTCHVLDPAGNPVPPGIPGELVIGGAGVARGYLGQPALTAERFVPDPFSGVADARLYRTGDLARRHGDGRLEILGRLDFQVKVRGFRVELGEIEAALTALPEIAQAVVVASASPGGDVHLIAHLIAAEASPPPSPAQLREQLAARLPAYMIPAAWRYVAAYPLTANHKIDRKALAACAGDHARAAGRAPHTPLERALAEIWKQVLGVARVDADDGFFELGGHSLTAVLVHAQVREVFRVDLPLAELLRHPTVAGLAALVESADPEPGRSARVAAAYLRVLAMTDEDKARLRDRRSGNGGAPS